MPLIKSNYKKPFYLWNAHLETIIPALTRKIKNISYERERITIFDGDFLDIDWYKHKNQLSKNLVIISHGLEGSSNRAYAMGLAKVFWDKGWEALAWNHRGCSGEINRKLRFYHSGASEDLRAVVDYVLQNFDYETIILSGFSLGGNMTLKYLGEENTNISKKIKKSVVFSVPLHLSSCSASLRKKENWVYANKFKKSLKKKVQEKSLIMPDKLSIEHFKKIKTLKDFDDFYTAPLHNFKNAEDYYEKSSSLYFLEKIQIPTLIINAQNDPFLAPPCFPYELAQNLKNIYFETPKKGGHCGFSPADKNGYYWSELRSWEFVNQKIGAVVESMIIK